MRTCPRCGSSLTEESLREEQIDRCKDCNGIFFDEGELERTSRLVEILTRIYLDEDDIEIEARTSPADARCPADGTTMIRTHIGNLEIDQCPACNGYWLDGGELAELHIIERHIRANLGLYLRLGS